MNMPRLKQLTISKDVTLDPSTPVVTFISRNLEPMRGFPTFMRALPTLLEKHPTVQIVIVGGDEVSYSSAPGDGRSWKDLMMEELVDELITTEFTYLDACLMTNSKNFIAGVIYTCTPPKAFVLSWSLLELMACGTPVLAEANPMMEELIEPGVNGALWRGKEETLAEAICMLLESPDELKRWGQAGKTETPANLHSATLPRSTRKKLLTKQASCF